MTKSDLIIVSNRSPVADFLKPSGQMTVGGLATALHRVAIENNATWYFGTDSGADLSGYKSPKSLEYTLKPVQIGKKEYKSFYSGFSNSLIWPLFHYAPNKCEFSNDDWIHYQSVNKKFAVEILNSVEENPDATIWIQDYHLFSVAKYLRQFGVKNKIGFFLHIPFPTYEVFRLLPQRKEILEGLLAFDVVGFHTKSYVTNFFRAVRNIVKDVRIFENDHYAEFNERKCFVEDFPISVDSQMIKNLVEQLQNSPGSSLNLNHLSNNKASLFKVGLGVDRLDYSKGILERFRAIEYFFKNNPKYRNKFTFIQIAVPSRGTVQDYQEYKLECEQIVSRINGAYGSVDWTPIIYINRAVPFETLIKYYNSVDFALVTPLRDGMNLVAKEFILSCKDDAALILSEMAGTAEEITKVELVNPYNQEQMSDAIVKCVENPGYQKSVLEDYREYLLENNVHKWSKDFIDELLEPGSKAEAELSRTKIKMMNISKAKEAELKEAS